jgi:hypothetical protein
VAGGNEAIEVTGLEFSINDRRVTKGPANLTFCVSPNEIVLSAEMFDLALIDSDYPFFLDLLKYLMYEKAKFMNSSSESPFRVDIREVWAAFEALSIAIHDLAVESDSTVLVIMIRDIACKESGAAKCMGEQLMFSLA